MIRLLSDLTSGLTSTPKQELRPDSLFDKKAFRQFGSVSIDSYTKGTYRPLAASPGDSGYSDSSDKIISPHDWNRKRYSEKMGGDSTLSLTESVPDRNGKKEASSDTPVQSVVSTLRSSNSPYGSKPVSTETPVSQHAPLAAVKSHPYRDILGSPAGSSKKLDSHSSRYAPSATPLTSAVSQLDKQREIFRQAKLSDSPAKKLESEKKQVVSNSQPDSRWRRSENSYKLIETKSKEASSTTNSQTQDSKPANQDFKPRESRSFQERNARKQRLDAGQIMTAVTSSQGTGDSSPKDKPKESEPKRPPPKQESVSGPAVSLKKRCIALALSSEKSISVDEKKIEMRGVAIPDLKPSSFEKPFDPSGSPSKLPAARPEPEPPADRPTPPPPSQAERLGFADFGCDLAPSDSDSDIFIAPFSPELKWALPLPSPPPPQAPSVGQAQRADTEPRKQETSNEKVNNITPYTILN